MSLEIFLLLLMITSVLTGLFTEGVKKLLDEAGKTYKSNMLAGAVSALLSIAIGSGYIILMEAELNVKTAVIMIALVLLSWLSAMVGYDKVIQAISQFKITEEK